MKSRRRQPLIDLDIKHVDEEGDNELTSRIRQISGIMPSLVVLPANPEDLQGIARVQFASFASDDGFAIIFPKGPTDESIQHTMLQMEHDMEEDRSCHIVVVKDAVTLEIAAFATWHFYPLRGQEEIEKEMLTDKYPLPADSNIEAGNLLIHDGVRKRHEVVAKHFGMGNPHAYLAVVGTSPKYRRQGAASMLVAWGCEKADDHNLPVYLEATQQGVAIYKKHDFTEVDRFRLNIDKWKKVDVFHDCMIRAARS